MSSSKSSRSKSVPSPGTPLFVSAAGSHRLLPGSASSVGSAAARCRMARSDRRNAESATIAAKSSSFLSASAGPSRTQKKGSRAVVRSTLALPQIHVQAPVQTKVPTSSPTRRSSSGSQTAIRQVATPSELDGLLTKQRTDGQVSVLMCSAAYCAGCRGVAPKYAKIAKAYDADADAQHKKHEVSFMKMDFVANEQFCRSSLGAENLPFFVVFKDGHIVSAEAIGWRTVSQKLVDRIDDALAFSPSQVAALSVPSI